MGARINFIFKDDKDTGHVVLYSHWGESDWHRDIALALKHSKPRWEDYSYCTRMMISYLIKDSILDELGFGIYAIVGNNLELGETTVVIDMVKKVVYKIGQEDDTPNDTGNITDWDTFITLHTSNLTE